MTSKRKCVFSDTLQTKYPFIRKCGSQNNTSQVYCNFCNSEFSVAHGGNADILQHIRTVKHKNCAVRLAENKTITNFVRSCLDNKTKKLAAEEGTWAYHGLKHNHSFRSADCTSKLIQNMFEPKYSSARTKSEAIITGVLEPMAMENVKADLNEVNFVTVCCDASNHKYIKLMPVMVRYFLPLEGVQLKVLELKDLPGESSDIVSQYLTEVITNFGLNKKITALCADNTNTNFGGSSRKGINNIFCKLKTSLDNPNIFGIGCMAHIINNCIKTACDTLPIDIELLITKVYGYFHIYTLRVEKLKEFCQFVEVEYRIILGYSRTRWLALLPAIERLLKMFPALKSYFLSIDKCPVAIENFFKNPETEFWLFFVHNLASLFHKTVLKIENEHISAIETIGIFEELINNIEERKNSEFLPLLLQNMLNSPDFETRKHRIKTHIFEFHETALEYLKEWKSPDSNKLGKFNWILLNKLPEFNDIQQCVPVLNERNQNIDENDLFSEFLIFQKYCNASMFLTWRTNSTPATDRWVYIFKQFTEEQQTFKNFLMLLEFSLCLPGTNAQIERVFSHINDIWSPEKTQLKVSTLKSLVITKLNFNMTCPEFFKMLLDNESALGAIHSETKYSFKAKTNN